MYELHFYSFASSGYTAYTTQILLIFATLDFSLSLCSVVSCHLFKENIVFLLNIELK